VLLPVLEQLALPEPPGSRASRESRGYDQPAPRRARTGGRGFGSLDHGLVDDGRPCLRGILKSFAVEGFLADRRNTQRSCGQEGQPVRMGSAGPTALAGDPWRPKMRWDSLRAQKCVIAGCRWR
jgi:hypothetical protein